MANLINISGPPLASVGESTQLGPIQITSTIVPLNGTIQSAGPASTTIAVPVAAAGIAFFPPSSNTFSLTLKGIAGDTGFRIPFASPSVIMLDSTAGGFNLALTTAGAAGTINYLIF